MQWLTVAWWRWRLAQALARNPVVRTSDRIEVAVMALAVAVSLVAMPVALAIGTAVHDEHARAYTAEQHDRHRVVATTTETARRARAGRSPSFRPDRRSAMSRTPGPSRGTLR